MKEKAVKQPYERVKLDQASKVNRLKTMEIFVLDNSLRETNVVQTRSHVLEDKEKIFTSLLNSGLKNLIVASFGDTVRVEDQFLRKLKMKGLRSLEPQKVETLFSVSKKI